MHPRQYPNGFEKSILRSYSRVDVDIAGYQYYDPEFEINFDRFRKDCIYPGYTVHFDLETSTFRIYDEESNICFETKFIVQIALPGNQ